MAVYLISYDLIPPGQKYNRVHTTIKSYGTWAKPLESTWFVKSNENVQDVRGKVLNVLDANDKLLVVEVTRNASAYGLPDEVWKWMNDVL
jgi:hypothetical protein